MAMQFVDGITIGTNELGELILALTRLNSSGVPILVTDRAGNPVSRVKLFAETLTDGSTTHTLEIHFEAGQ